MTTIPQVAHTMQVILQETAQQIGRASGFVQRQSPLGGAELAQTLVFGWLTNPQATLEELAQTAATVGVSISAQDLDQRLGQRAADCMQQVLRQGAQQMLRAETVPLSVWEHFTGVYVQDSTTVNLPADLADVWPGCGGGHTPGDGAAALKIQVQWELQAGPLRLSAVALQAGRTADRTANALLAQLPQGALGWPIWAISAWSDWPPKRWPGVIGSPACRRAPRWWMPTGGRGPSAPGWQLRLPARWTTPSIWAPSTSCRAGCWRRG